MERAVAEPRARSFRVRRAEPGDAAELVERGRAVGAEPEGWLVTDGEWRTASEERRYLRAIRRSPHATVIVAESPDRIVGRLSMTRDPHPASKHVADLGLLVAIDFRRRGVGRALMLAADDWAHSVGVRKIELHVFPHNTGAISLYEDLDYRREGVRRGQYRRGTTYVDAILMAKDVW